MHNPNCASRTDQTFAEIGALADTERTCAGTRRHRPRFIGNDVFRRSAFNGNHPLNIIRHSAVLDLAKALDWLSVQNFLVSIPAGIEQLAEFHDRDYIDALRDADSTGFVSRPVRERYAIGTFENPLFPGLFTRAAMTVGGSIMAAHTALEHGVAFHPSGGTHHGRRDKASGFCYFNDPVFAILTLLNTDCSRVLYVDIDAHHGDGVQDAFADDRRVMTVSIHETDRWPFTGAVDDRGCGQARNLPVPTNLNDSEFDHLIRNAVLPLAEAFDPDALVVTCGADGLAGDPLSNMALSNLALWDSVQQLVALGHPTVILGGGGYNPWTVARCWTGLWGRLTGRQFPATLPASAAEILRAMECDLIDEDEFDPAWLTTLADDPNAGMIRKEIRFLADQALES